MAKRKAYENTAAREEKVKQKSSKMGLYRAVGGAVMMIIGILLVIMNLTGVLMAMVGLVLIYFGFKILGGIPSRLITL